MDWRHLHRAYRKETVLRQLTISSLLLAVCMPPCENGGICSAPNECNCAEEWTGDTCTQRIARLYFFKSTYNPSFLIIQLSVTLTVPMEGLALPLMNALALRNGLESTAQNV